MAKTNTVLIKLVSSADTGFFYVTKKNPAHEDQQARAEEIRSRRAQTRRLQGSKNQIGRPRNSSSAGNLLCHCARRVWWRTHDNAISSASLCGVERVVGALQHVVTVFTATGR